VTPLSRASIRLRLTLVYAVVLVAAGAGVLAINDLVLYNSLYAHVNATLEEAANVPRPPDDGAADAGKKTDQPQQDDRGKDAKRDYNDAVVAKLRATTLRNSTGASALALAIAAVLGLGVSWLVAGRMLRPLRTLTAATRRISHDRLHERVALSGPRDELKELADTFDAMVSRLEASFSSQRRFVADAAHELRTPLAIIRTGAEVQLAKREPTREQWSGMARRVLLASGRAERMLDGLLALARSDSGVIAHEPHDLAVAAGMALSEADGEAELGGLSVTCDLLAAPATGDPALLDRLVGNLVSNAVRHNRPGGWVTVSTGRVDGRARVTVRNSGGVIPPDQVERLFEPFQRLAGGRAADGGSTGLGLAIVRSIVAAHHGTVTATPDPRGGLAVTVTLPAAAI
jgi:signal transduction histidine kinase